MELQTFSQQITVASYDVEPGEGMRLSNILRYQQEIGEQHLIANRWGWHELFEAGAAFVITRLRLQIDRLPRLEETVTLTTWHRERRGARFLRCYEWRDAAGALLMSGVTEFVLVSAREHKMLWEIPPAVRELPSCPERGVCPDPGRVALKNACPVGEHTVRRSDLDCNRHMNNARYIDVALDWLPEFPIREIELQYIKEMVPGETATVRTEPTEGGYLVEMLSGENYVFRARILAQENDGV